MITLLLDGVRKYSQGIMGGMLWTDSPKGMSLCAGTEGLRCGTKPAVQFPDWKKSLIERLLSIPRDKRQGQVACRAMGARRVGVLDCNPQFLLTFTPKWSLAGFTQQRPEKAYQTCYNRKKAEDFMLWD